MRDIARFSCAQCMVLVLFLVVATRVTSRENGDASPTPPQRENLPETLYYYQPVAGKVVGIWPAYWNLESLTLLKGRYGFSGLLILPDTIEFRTALQAGFSPANLMVQLWDTNYTFAVNNLPIGSYYIDEPVEHDCYGHTGGSHLYTPQELAVRRDYIRERRPAARFVISSYKRCNHNRIAASYADVMMYASYKNWDLFGIPFCHVNMGWGDEYESPWLPGSEDQRNSWTSMRNAYGAKFTATWIHGLSDEYPDLCAHANALGLQELWVYDLFYQPLDTIALESFCTAAWQNGWLQRVPYEPLPIQLASFTAAVQPDGGVLLEWTTLCEVNNYGFEVQVSPRDSTHYATVSNSFVPGHGTTNVPHHYRFAVNTPPPEAYYRLKQIDLDGSVWFSEGVFVSTRASSARREDPPAAVLLQQNYPNPFNPNTTISYRHPFRGQVALRIFDVLGREVCLLVNRVEEPGWKSVVWDASRMAGGVYFYQLRAGGAVETKMLLLLN